MTKLSVPYSLLPIIISCGLALFAQTSSAENTESPARWFEVELLVFQHSDTNSDERWTEEFNEIDPQPLPGIEPIYGSADNVPDANGSPQAEAQETPISERRMINLHNSNGTPLFAQNDGSGRSQGETSHQAAIPEGAWTILPPTQLQLLSEATYLNEANDYQVLFHQAWRQPMTVASDSAWIVIRGGERFADEFSLDGSVRFSLKRYLHATTELNYREFVPFQSSEIPDDYIAAFDDNGQMAPLGEQSISNTDIKQYKALRTFRLQESRRMRSGELHYIDSPVMGVLIKITPFKSNNDVIEIIEEPTSPIAPISEAVTDIDTQ